MKSVYNRFFEWIESFFYVIDIRGISITIMDGDKKVFVKKSLDYDLHLNKKATELNIQICENTVLLITLNVEATTDQTSKWEPLITNQWKLTNELHSYDYQLRAKELLLYTSKKLSSSLRLEDLLSMILDNTLDVIEAADSCSLYLYDEHEELLVPKVTRGFNWKYIKEIKFKPGESLTGMTYLNQKPMIFHKSKDVYKGMETMRPENWEYFLKSLPLVNDEPAVSKSAMCCPFIVKGKCLGVVSINNFFGNAHFKEEDLELLEAICNQAALVIDRVNLFQITESRAEALKKLNNTIKKKNEMLKYASKTHKQLTELVLQQKGIEVITQTISVIIKKPIIIYDEFVNVLATSNSETEYGFEIDMPPFLEQFKQMSVTMEEIEISPSSNNPIRTPILLEPIIKSNEVKGYMLILKGNDPLDELEHMSIEHACTVVALELLKREVVYETKQRLKGEFLDDIQSNVVDIELLKKQAKYLGISDKYKYNFITVDIHSKQSEDVFTGVKNNKYLQLIIERIITQKNPDSLVFNRKNGLKALVAWNNETEEDSFLSKAKTLISEIERMIHQYVPHLHCSYGVGRIVDSVDKLPLSYSDVTQCSEIMKKKNMFGQMITYREIGPAKIIMKSTEEELYQFVIDQLQPLIQYNHQNRNELINTLEVYLNFNQNMKETAQELHLHLNTLSYRIKRIEEILGLQLKDGTTIFNLQLAWHILNFLGVKDKWLKLKQ
ncbi:helix-turn-helix domain-containing protein [Anaerobacillus sp. MEB173]|uniref:helix-turn-helix domain-containing protein n=1 Tax=Anaerobacillus sp. MEB173 TaxID=3383345 RepID=UPI003F8F19DD